MRTDPAATDKPGNIYLSGKLKLLMGHYYLRAILWRQRIFKGAFIKEITTLSTILTTSLFPGLREAREEFVTIRANKTGDSVTINSPNNETLQAPERSPRLAAVLAEDPCGEIRLDPLLEQEQIVQALTVLEYASHSLRRGEPSRLARTLLDPQGLNAFCCRIKVEPAASRIVISYSYCELFYSFTVKTILQSYTRSKNHQALFALAPRFGTLVGILFLLHHLFWAPYSIQGIIAATLGALGLGSGITYLINTLASTVYDQEHRDRLLHENTREIRALSYFPLHNPNPILKIGTGGAVIFANEAAHRLADAMGLSKDRLLDILPENHLRLISECLKNNQEFLEIDSQRHGKTVRYKISPIPGERAVLIAGTDISRIKALEAELKGLNKNLEALVEERTAELQATQDITILSLSTLAESRDQETGAHLQRTRLYVKTLAEELRGSPAHRDTLDDDKIIDLLYRSAPLHDIGKVGIPDAILHKGDRLNAEEFAIMKQHPQIGGDALQWAEEKLGANSFLKLAREIAYYHHEWWDGTGYPFALAGPDIPIAARLMALADVYDALTSKRVYKEAFSHQKSKEIILQGRGSHFDPDIVDAFLAREDDFRKIHQDNING